jgi:hypothetical protein
LLFSEKTLGHPFHAPIPSSHGNVLAFLKLHASPLRPATALKAPGITLCLQSLEILSCVHPV